MSEKNADYNNFIDFGLYIGRRLFNRKSWMHNFVTFSRNFWEVLNIVEIHKRLRRVKPFVSSLIKNGGSILVIGNWYNLHNEVFDNIFGEYPYNSFIEFFSGEWPKGALRKTGDLRFLNLYRLPSLIIIYDFKDSENVLKESKRLGIPILGFVDNRVHQHVIDKNITIPIGLGTSSKSIVFVFLLIKSYISQGIALLNYEVLSGSFVDQSYKKIKDLKHYCSKDGPKVETSFRRFFFHQGHFYRLFNKVRFSKEVWEEMEKKEQNKYIDYNKVFKVLRYQKGGDFFVRSEFESFPSDSGFVLDGRGRYLTSEIQFFRGTMKRYRGVLKQLFSAMGERGIKKNFNFMADLKKNPQIEVTRVKYVKKKVKKGSAIKKKV